MSAEPLVESSQPPQQPFVHLHVHTEYSLLDGLSKVDKLVAHARDLGMTSLAISDHGAMHGVVSFYRACKNAGIKPIIGMEGYLAKKDMRIHDQTEKSPYHLLLLARNETGYRNLLKIASAAQLEGFYMRPRIDREFLAQHAEGLICTSGCLAAEIPRMVEDGKDDEALRTIGLYQDMFGKENFFLELQHHDIPQLTTLNRWLLEHRDHANVPLLATNDVHYVRYEDYDAHDTLLCIQTGAHKSEAKRMRMADPSYFLRSPSEMWDLFEEVPEALLNTVRVAEMCDVSAFFEQKGYHLPIFPVPDGYDEETYLRHLAERGLRWRYGEKATQPLYKDRLNYELGVIHKMGFDTYFLIVWDLCQFARQADIWWNVRGSGAGSVTAYSLGITNIDPIANNLIFERFLNPGRVSMPDIDMDFPDDRRMEMIDYASHKYGTDKVAAIITFGTLKARAAIKDVGRVLDYPLPDVNNLTRLVPQIPSRPVSLTDCLGDDDDKAVPELKQLYENDNRIRKLLDTAKTVEGVARNAGTHAAGVIIGDKPLVEYLPLHRPIGDTTVSQVTQFTMEICESIGLLKVDFLGLSTLTIMRKACELIEKYRGEHFSMDNIPYRPNRDDPDLTKRVEALFDLMGRGETTGVFQLESDGMKKMLVQMRPRTFEHVIAAISLYRPGPMDLIPTYIRRMHGQEALVYHHEKLAPILKETYGICVSGDAEVIEAKTGRRYQIRDIDDKIVDFFVQGVDEDYKPAVGRIIRWLDNGIKPVYRVTLRNGATVKTTIDHRFLTETGWRRLQDIEPGDYVATPPHLVEPEHPITFQREKLRLLAYLIADGSLASGASVDFVNKDPVLIEEYVRCLGIFDDLEPVYTPQIHGVTRVGIRSNKGTRNVPSTLLKWMRELGFKYGPTVKKHPCGVRSQEKSIPTFIFSLNNEELAFFLSSLWDCDGYVGRKLCHYKTISRRLAYDVQTLLLRFGIASSIYQTRYVSSRGERHAYQVTLYDTARFIQLVKPHLLSIKRKVICTGTSQSDKINRQSFVDEIKSVTRLSARAIHAKYGVDRQHFYPARLRSERIPASIVRAAAEAIPLPRTWALTNTSWEQVNSIEPAGEERVYDLTVEGIHNFVANNIIVHNCVYQEQIQQIAAQLFGYSLGDADLMRRAVSKKKKKDLDQHKAIFMERGPDHGVSADVAEKIFGEIEFFAAYGFNKSHAADYAVLTCQTAYLKAHYPEEYYTALLSVQRDNIADVALFTSDCRRFGIPILPPNVNGSDLDFTIEIRSDGKRCIRYGLGAIKNAGEKALQSIIEARQAGGPFQDITDFCRRVDLRQVGKRAVESLIKAGAFDVLAAQEPDRDALLLALDRLMKYSGDHHHAKEIGQISLFGDAGIGDDVVLPSVPADKKSDKRERLKWEKELIGLYVSPHPLTEIAHQIQHVPNIQYSDTLQRDADLLQDRAVTVVGLVLAIRNITTKNNDTMAIVSLEDITGTIDCVFFPRTWRQYEEIVQPEQLIVVRGKADASRGNVQVIVENASLNVDLAIAIDGPNGHAEQRTDYAPPPYSPPDDVSTEPPDTDSTPPDEDPGYVPPRYEEPPNEPTPAMPQNGNGHRQSEEVIVPVTNDPLPNEPMEAIEGAPSDEEEANEPRAPQMLTIVIQLSDDPKRDRLRLEKLKNELTQYPGKDRFRFVLDDTAKSQKVYTMEFPNENTCYDQTVVQLLDNKIKKNLVHSVKVEALPQETDQRSGK